jgi:hypothetical protein
MRIGGDFCCFLSCGGERLWKRGGCWREEGFFFGGKLMVCEGISYENFEIKHEGVVFHGVVSLE